MDESGHPASGMVRTVLGDIAPSGLGVTLMHEHAPVLDWSELYEQPVATVAPHRERILGRASELLGAFAETLTTDQGPGTLVEATPIRVGRYPDLLTDLARRSRINIVAATGFWTEALAPHHPWALRLALEPDGVKRMANLFIREITNGMEDPSGRWGERFTGIKAGIIKIGTSRFMTPIERTIHRAAALASLETGCPITTHTNHGGGWEQLQLLLGEGVPPERIIIGHQGHLDDGELSEAPDYHRRLAETGCYVQFDRVGYPDYEVDKQARLIMSLAAAGDIDQILVSHDTAPLAAAGFASSTKPEDPWQEIDADFTIVTARLIPALREAGLTGVDVRSITIDNPARALAF